MAIARSKLTAQGQISVPAEVRRRLGVGPGSVVEWEEVREGIIVKKAGDYSTADVRRALFPDGKKVKPASEAALKQGIRDLIRRKHARD